MYIQPGTVIHLLKDVPLNNTYKHTLYFDSTESQFNYFATKIHKTFNNHTYQREDIGVVRVNIGAHELYGCNYLMFKNTNYDSKWFYAFITSVEYISNVVTRVTYQIDVMQTWFFSGECEIAASFVEREHSLTDEIGDNIVPENVDIGPYILSRFEGTDYMDDWKILVTVTERVLGTPTTGGFYNGVFSQAEYIFFDCTEEGLADLRLLLMSGELPLITDPESIINIQMIPAAFVRNPTDDYNLSKREGEQTVSFDKPTNLGEYTEIKNNKLLTYPFNFLSVSNMQGEIAQYAYEFFNTDSVNFSMYADMSAEPVVTLLPKAYKTDNYLGSRNGYERLVMRDFPHCTYRTSNFISRVLTMGIKSALFAGGLAVTGAGLAGSAIGGASAASAAPPLAETGLAVYTGAIPMAGQAQAALGGHVSLTPHEFVNQPKYPMIADNLIHASKSYGVSMPYGRNATGDSNGLIGLGMFDYQFAQTFITPEYAKKIDDYFSAYGYAVNAFKVPNINGRPCWNYVKTINANILGSIPVDAYRTIQQIFDSGVTFWKTHNAVLDYSQNNSPA